MTAADGLTHDELSWARAAVGEAIVRRRNDRALVPHAYGALLQRIDSLLQDGAVCGTNGESASVEWDLMIDTAEASRLLGCRPEYVRRIAARLGGRRVGARWVYPRQAVIEHLEGTRR